MNVVILKAGEGYTPSRSYSDGGAGGWNAYAGDLSELLQAGDALGSQHLTELMAHYDTGVVS